MPYTVLNNLERDPGQPYARYFDITLFKPATAALPELTEIVNRWSESASRAHSSSS